MVPLTIPQLIASLNGRAVWPLLLVCAVLAGAIFRRYWTPIRDIPGPFLASFSSLWQIHQLWKGHTEEEIIKLHKRHGMLAQPTFKSPFNQ